MKQFKTIFAFEFSGYLKNKVFVGLTVIMVLITAVFLFSPRFSSTGSFNVDDAVVSYAEHIQLASKVDYDLEKLKSSLEVLLEGSEIEIVPCDEAAMKKAVSEGETDYAVIVTSPLSYKYIVNTAGFSDITGYEIDEAFLSVYQPAEFEKEGVSAERISEILSSEVKSEAEIIGNDQSSSFAYTYILMMMLYFAVIMYGQFVAQGVATEKSSRTMELLITSAKPVSLMFGKILGAGAAGFSQLIIILGNAALCYRLNLSYWQDNFLVNSVFGMDLRLIAYTALFFALGFLIYSFMYGALASLASRLEDVSALTMPVSLIMVGAFMLTMFSMLKDVDNVLMKIASFFPLTSPMAMFTRIAMGNVPAWQIALSVAILLISTVLIGYLAAAIYKVGVLMYGKPPKLNELSRALRNNKISSK